MLRITQKGSPTGWSWVLCGQLAGRWVEEFRSQWRQTPGQHSIDLKDVTFVDEAGEALLREIQETGANLIAGPGVANRDLLENLQTNGCRPVRRMFGRADETE